MDTELVVQQDLFTDAWFATERKRFGTDFADSSEEACDQVEQLLGVTTARERRLLAVSCGWNYTLVAQDHGGFLTPAGSTIGAISARLWVRAKAQEAADAQDLGNRTGAEGS